LDFTPVGRLAVTILNVTGAKVAMALDRAEESAALTAVILTLLDDVWAGAVHRPSLEIVPAVVDQFTAVLLVFFTSAVNCTLAPEAKEVDDGEIWTLMELLPVLTALMVNA